MQKHIWFGHDATLLVTTLFLADVDLWALACTCHRLFAQRLQFCSILIRQAGHSNFQLPPDIAFRRLIVWMLGKSKKKQRSEKRALHFGLHPVVITQSLSHFLPTLHSLTILDLSTYFDDELVSPLPLSLQTLELDFCLCPSTPNHIRLSQFSNLQSLSTYGGNLAFINLPPSLVHLALDAKRHPQAKRPSPLTFRGFVFHSFHPYIFPEGLRHLKLSGIELEESDAPMFLPRSLETLHVTSDSLSGLCLKLNAASEPDWAKLREFHCMLRSVMIPDCPAPTSLTNLLHTWTVIPHLVELDLTSECPQTPKPIDLRSNVTLQIVRCHIRPVSLHLPLGVHTLDTDFSTFCNTVPTKQLQVLILRQTTHHVHQMYYLQYLLSHFPQGVTDLVKEKTPLLREFHLQFEQVALCKLAKWIADAATWTTSFLQQTSIYNPCFVLDAEKNWRLFFTCPGCDPSGVKPEPRGKGGTFVGHLFYDGDRAIRCTHQKEENDMPFVLVLSPLLCSACVSCQLCLATRK